MFYWRSETGGMSSLGTIHSQVMKITSEQNVLCIFQIVILAFVLTLKVTIKSLKWQMKETVLFSGNKTQNSVASSQIREVVSVVF
jgi:hypothetical protein